MEDSQFFGDHLNFEQHGQNPQQVPLQASIKRMKNSIMKDTEQPTDLEQPIRRNPGEGPRPKDRKLDQIYVNLVICEGRAYYHFPEDRWEQLKVYPKPANASQSVGPEGIIHALHKNVLLVGRPGIGKTMLCLTVQEFLAAKHVVDTIIIINFIFRGWHLTV